VKRAIWLVAVLACACDREDANTVTATGTLEIIEVDVAPLMTARVDRVLVEDGDTVRAGDTLVVLRQPSNTGELSQREASVSASRAGLAEAERGPRAAEIVRAQSEVRALDAEATKLANDATRAKRLYDAGAISQQQHEAAVTAAREAALRRESARQTLVLLQQGTRQERIAGARAQVEGAQASLSALEATVDALTLVAPSSGVVLSRNVEPGETVTAGQSAVTLGESARPWVRVYVNALAVPGVRVGAVARAKLDGLPGREFTGRVVAINTKAEFTPRVALTENERADMTFGVKIEFDDNTGTLKPGLPVTVTIPLAAERQAPD
jgi:HlyD family secretion protein